MRYFESLIENFEAITSIIIAPVLHSVREMPLRAMGYGATLFASIGASVIFTDILKQSIDVIVSSISEGSPSPATGYVDITEFSPQSVIALLAATYILNYSSRSIVPFLSSKLISNASEELVEKIVNRSTYIPLQDQQASESGALFNNIHNARDLLKSVIDKSMGLVENTGHLLPSLLLIYRGSPTTAAIFLTASMVTSTSSYLAIMAQRESRESLNEANSALQTHLVDLSSNHELILATQSQEHESDINKSLFVTAESEFRRFNNIYHYKNMVEDVVMSSSIAALNFILLGYGCIAQNVGEITRINLLFNRTLSTNYSMFGKISYLYSKMADISRINKLIKSKNKQQPKSTSRLFRPSFIRHSHDLQVRKVNIISGTSGCGKTTFARFLAGLLEPDSEHTRHLGHVAYIPSRAQLFTQRSLIDNIYHDLEPSHAIDARFGHVMQVCNIEELVATSRSVKQLSDGECKRISLARGLMQNFNTIIIDEPEAGLDPRNRYEIIQNIINFCRGKTLIMITHDQQVENMGDYKITMTPILSDDESPYDLRSLAM